MHTCWPLRAAAADASAWLNIDAGLTLTPVSGDPKVTWPRSVMGDCGTLLDWLPVGLDSWDIVRTPVQDCLGLLCKSELMLFTNL